MKKDVRPTVIIRREEIIEGGHHGGAWKVAYADFVTAMMAFFLLMWLLNATTQEQKRGLADYFSPNSLTSRTTAGFGAPFGGLTPNLDGSLASDRGSVQVTNGPTRPIIDMEESEGETPVQPFQQKVNGPTLLTLAEAGATSPVAVPSSGLSESERIPPGLSPPPTQPITPTAAAKAAELQAEREQRERVMLEQAADQIRDAVRSDPALAGLAKQLAIDLTPEGLRIQIMDEDRQPMFAFGSAALNDRARVLLSKVAPVLLRLPQPVAIEGHTDAAPYRGADRSNWDLSAERANATRKLLADAGLPESRMRSVAGHAARDLLLPATPLAAANRRIAILVLRDRPVVPGR